MNVGFVILLLAFSNAESADASDLRRTQVVSGSSDKTNNIAEVAEHTQRTFTVVGRHDSRRFDAGIPTTLEQARNLSARERENSSINNPWCDDGCFCYSSLEVHCTFQQITTVPSVFPPNTKKINLAYNKITRLPDNRLSVYGSTLRFLFLQSNRIRSVRGGVLAGLENLSILRLSWNQLSAVQKNSFRDLRALKRLYLDNNRLYFIHPEAFLGLTKLRSIQLEGNALTRLHPDTFVTVRFGQYFRYSNVQYLYLSNNKFTVFPRSILAGINRLKHVYLHGNPWECSCHLPWLHQWIRESGKYRCKRSIFSRNQPAICATCQSPGWLRQQEISRVHFSNITCTPPSLIDRRGARHVRTTDYNVDSSLTEIENEALLYKHGTKNKLRGSFRLDNRVGSLVLMHCNATERPEAYTTRIGYTNFTFVGRLSVRMKCWIEYPERQRKLNRILSPYLNSALNLTSFAKRRKRYRTQYRLSIIGEPLTKLPPPAFRLRSATLAKASRILHQNKTRMIIFGNRFRPEDGTLEMLLQTRVEFRPSAVNAADQAWTMVIDPRPDYIATLLFKPGKMAVIKCTAMGYPKPTISWILPNKRLVGAGKRFRRFIVTMKGKLFIRGVRVSDSGIYRCLATSSKRIGTSGSSDIGAKRVQVVPDVYEEIDTPSVHLTKGKDEILNCETLASPGAVYAWTLPSNTILTGERQDDRFQSFKNGTLVIRHTLYNDSGLYSCIAANRAGYMTANYKVQIQNMTEIMTTEAPGVSTDFIFTTRPLLSTETPNSSNVTIAHDVNMASHGVTTGGLEETTAPKTNISSLTTKTNVAASDSGNDRETYVTSTISSSASMTSLPTSTIASETTTSLSFLSTIPLTSSTTSPLMSSTTPPKTSSNTSSLTSTITSTLAPSINPTTTPTTVLSTTSSATVSNTSLATSSNTSTAVPPSTSEIFKTNSTHVENIQIVNNTQTKPLNTQDTTHDTINGHHSLKHEMNTSEAGEYFNRIIILRQNREHGEFPQSDLLPQERDGLQFEYGSRRTVIYNSDTHKTR
nr:immunoglobulin superfamily member 10-like isoform X1 [Ciona intestinalis]|eukprot:XP_026694669.1 immunoglobulin superfamily member 10-like isoform X1 [Ciona intestinalis]